ncbi:MAG: hypothetical protein K6B14_05130 [Lachnospiraceae bacterium]|nr:hypothetical protein [Lachnospiraceae bacterium]
MNAIKTYLNRRVLAYKKLYQLVQKKLDDPKLVVPQDFLKPSDTTDPQMLQQEANEAKKEYVLHLAIQEDPSVFTEAQMCLTFSTEFGDNYFVNNTFDQKYELPGVNMKEIWNEIQGDDKELRKIMDEADGYINKVGTMKRLKDEDVINNEQKAKVTEEGQKILIPFAKKLGLID